MKTWEPRSAAGGAAAAERDAATAVVPAGQDRPAASRARRLASATPIREAAARLFLQKGYQATSMDDVAAAARVSKQTIYTHFANKEELFADLVLGNVGRVDEFAETVAAAVSEGGTTAERLGRLARRYVGFVIRPEVLQLRRLVIGEAGRFPDLAATYFEKVPERTYDLLAGLFRDLAARGELAVDDPVVAAYHFVWLTLGQPLDRAMFRGGDDGVEATDLDALVAAGVDVFLAAYAVPPRALEATSA